MRLSFKSAVTVGRVTALAVGVASCGGGGESPADPTPPTTVAAQPTPAPTPVPTPVPVPNPLGLASGPVATVKVGVKQVESPSRGSGVFRPVEKNNKEEFVLYVGEFVV